jgi:hypothetical protein
MLRKLLATGPRGWLELTEAQLWIAWAALLVTLRPRGQLVSSEPLPSPPAPASDPEPIRGTGGFEERAAVAIQRVARHGIGRPQCLIRSLALQRMLSAHGIRGAVVRFGVRKVEGEFESHAWVEQGGRILGDDPLHVRSFTPLDTLSVGRAPSP